MTPDGACDERTTLKPATPYAASKAAADLLSYQYTRNPGLDIVRVRLFNQIGPRQSADYAAANFARQIAAAEAGKQPPVIETGDLTARRDITDVRDMVAAFPLLLETGRTGEAYNAGRGETFRIQELLDKLIALATSEGRGAAEDRAGAKGRHRRDPRRPAQAPPDDRLGAADHPRPDSRGYSRRLAENDNRQTACVSRLVAVIARISKQEEDWL